MWLLFGFALLGLAILVGVGVAEDAAEDALAGRL